jgi:hypothetical protein
MAPQISPWEVLLLALLTALTPPVLPPAKSAPVPPPKSRPAPPERPGLVGLWRLERWTEDVQVIFRSNGDYWHDVPGTDDFRVGRWELDGDKLLLQWRDHWGDWNAETVEMEPGRWEGRHFWWRLKRPGGGR